MKKHFEVAMYIGIDIGGTHIKAVITNQSGDTIGFTKTSTPKSACLIESKIINIINSFTKSQSISIKKIKSIGIGAAGSIDKQKGIIIASPNIPVWDNYPLIKRIKEATGIVTFLENDATAAVIGEWWKGHGNKFKNWIMLTLGTGIGGGAVINNQLYTGKQGSAMEFGHITIDYNGRKCPCGNRGCLEMYASATALVRTIRRELWKYTDSTIYSRIHKEELTAKIVYEEINRGDKFAFQTFLKVSTLLGIGIANLVNIFNPEAVIIGGGLSRAHKLILPVIKDVVGERALDGLKEDIKYLVVKDEDKKAALGAAKVAIDNQQNL
ncbi:MAG: ROK family protein [Spirochaetota bacterium]|nr:ROK family protein [Spirochaetota bacterium]